MAAFVVAPPAPPDLPAASTRLNIFPGSATPTVFPANAPFWIGYGFVPEQGSERRAHQPLGDETRFELEVDGQPVDVFTDLRIEAGVPVGRVDLAAFGEGLPAGWHRFAGRWYDVGGLALTCDRSIEFVER